MPARTQCPRCETVLNVPVGAEGKKLKCPRCTTTFRVGDAGSTARPSQPSVDTATAVSSPSSNHVPRRPPSDSDAPGRPAVPPVSSRRPPSDDDEPDLPVISGDLRDQFNLPLLFEEDEDRPASPPKPSPPKPKPAEPPAQPPSSGVFPTAPAEGPSPYAEADAAGLIEDDEPVRPRRKTGAEARFTTRRCSCGGVVPAGMSICPRCHTDIETGQRDEEFDLLDEPPPLPPPPTPFGVLIVGFTSALVGAGLAIASIALYFVQSGLPYRWGFLLLAAVSAFGVFAAVRLIRNRSARFLIAALILGGLVDVVALIVMPIALASSAPVDSFQVARPSSDDSAPVVDTVLVPRIVPLTERIAWDKVNLGLAILAVTVTVSIYLTSPTVRRYTQRR
ncbi:MJ0042-type zinc finger domain-containing protein [Tautonia marina]|uniref:MJ0042-type zinc finger domain-containing protein n=1 Tax=Tautonia marina TaxID=2653855 RepID=UPI0013758D3C|nr:MJ0042-type zinc finger domain-containing protein [Tautonia marina]